MQQIDPDQIARAGALARWGTFANAAITAINHAHAEDRVEEVGGRLQLIHRPGVYAAIEENRRRQVYSSRLTELHDLAGYPREWWER